MDEQPSFYKWIHSPSSGLTLWATEGADGPPDHDAIGEGTLKGWAEVSRGETDKGKGEVARITHDGDDEALAHDVLESVKTELRQLHPEAEVTHDSTGQRRVAGVVDEALSGLIQQYVQGIQTEDYQAVYRVAQTMLTTADAMTQRSYGDWAGGQDWYKYIGRWGMGTELGTPTNAAENGVGYRSTVRDLLSDAYQVADWTVKLFEKNPKLAGYKRDFKQQYLNAKRQQLADTGMMSQAMGMLGEDEGTWGKAYREADPQQAMDMMDALMVYSLSQSDPNYQSIQQCDSDVESLGRDAARLEQSLTTFLGKQQEFHGYLDQLHQQVNEGWPYASQYLGEDFHPSQFFQFPQGEDGMTLPEHWGTHDKTSYVKLASRIMYHVTNQANRESIMQRGLLAGGTDREQWGNPWVHYLWLFPNYERAQEAAAMNWGNSQGNNDIWAVNTDGLNVFPDPHGYAGAMATEQDIPPDRVSLATGQEPPNFTVPGQQLPFQSTYYEPQYPWIADTDGNTYLGGPGETHEHVAERHNIPQWRRQHQGVIFKGEVVHSSPMPPQAVLQSVEGQWAKDHKKDFETRKERGQFSAKLAAPVPLGTAYFDGKPVQPGQILLDFRGDPMIFVRVLRNPELGRSGKLLMRAVDGDWEQQLNDSVFNVEIRQDMPDAVPPAWSDTTSDTPEQIDTMMRNAAMSRTKRLDMARRLPHDQSNIVHDFGNGWTVRQLQNNGDRHREGHLMSNCWRFEPDEIPVDNLSEFMQAPLKSTAPSAGSLWYSLRDQDNLPHVSFYQNPDSTDHQWPGGDLQMLLGTHNSAPKEQYTQMLRQYAYENGLDFPGFVATSGWEPPEPSWAVPQSQQPPSEWSLIGEEGDKDICPHCGEKMRAHDHCKACGKLVRTSAHHPEWNDNPEEFEKWWPEQIKRDPSELSDEDWVRLRQGWRASEYNDMENWNSGGCHMLTEPWDGQREWGYFIHPEWVDDGEDEQGNKMPYAVDHYWLRQPDGSIIDPTSDQFGLPDYSPVARIPADDPRQERYYNWEEHTPENCPAKKWGGEASMYGCDYCKNQQRQASIHYSDSFGGGGNMPAARGVQDGWSTTDMHTHTFPEMRKAPMPAMDHPRQIGFDTSKTYFGYLNGDVAFAPTLHGAMQKVCVDRLDDNTTRRLTNLMAAGAYPQGLEYNVAGGVMHNNRPRILATNVDRNAVYDAVLQAANKKQSAGAKLCNWCDKPATWWQSSEMDSRPPGRTYTDEAWACDDHKQQYLDEMTLAAAEPGSNIHNVMTEPYWPTPGQLFQTSSS